MTDVKSWRFWVIVLLALTTLACAGRRERREQAREDRRERLEQRRAERQERLEQRRAERQRQREQPQEEPQQAAAEPAPQPAPPPRQSARQQRQSAAATPTPVASAPSAAAADSGGKIVFMRVSKLSSGVNAALFDVTEPGDPKYIGTINSASKLSYPVKPGLYTFMAVGETAEFMQATVVAGKTYYALVIPRSGAKRFTVEPVRQNEIDGKEFVSWDRSTRLMSDGTKQPYDPAEVSEKRQRYWQEWMRKSEAQRAELTLNGEDGK